TSEGPVLSDEVWKLDLPTMTWSKCSTRLKMPHFFHASDITPDGCLYIFGGRIDKSMYPSNKLQRAWMRPPKLQYLAMFSPLKSNPYLENGQNEEIYYTETIRFMKNAVNC
uniref:Uncharacterized protein n=1 Tax=Acrobeloides nanus TaxID=290746 RepID=A0A914CEF2_9BILA